MTSDELLAPWKLRVGEMREWRYMGLPPGYDRRLFMVIAATHAPIAAQETARGVRQPDPGIDTKVTIMYLDTGEVEGNDFPGDGWGVRYLADNSRPL
jgi:hypothetical protein